MPNRRLSTTQAAQISIYTTSFATISNADGHGEPALVYQAAGTLTRYEKDLSCVVPALVIDARASIGDDEAQSVGATIEDAIHGGNHHLAIVPLGYLVALFVELGREAACHLACNSKWD